MTIIIRSMKLLGVPSEQVYSISLDDDAESLINDRIKTKENKGKLTLQVVSIDNSGHLDVNIRQGLMKAREIILVVTGAEKVKLSNDYMKKMVNQTFTC